MAKYLYMGVVLAAIMSITPVYGDTNIVQNPGFEGGTDSWEGRGGQIEAVTTPVHGGSQAAKAVDRKETWQGIKQSLIGKVVNGKTYKLSGWVRLDNSDSDNITLSIEMEDDNPVKYINIETLTCSNTEWTELSGEFTPGPTGELKTLDLYFEGPAENVNFFVDDVSVTEVSAAAATPEPNKPAKVEPGAPKTDPNMPAKDANEAKQKSNATGINESTATVMKNEAVVGSQKQ
jgi:hypothetical protein